MLGKWRTGKTDASLLIGYLAKKWGLIDKLASNIYTFENPLIKEVTTLPSLKRWIHFDRLIKLYILDEALGNLPSRRAMSRKSVGFMTFLAELSKGHGRMILCTQSTKVDSIIWDSAFLRAVFTKLNKKVMVCRSKLFPELTFKNLPKSPIRFDPDRLADFSETESLFYSETSLEYKVAYAYAVKGMTQGQIAEELGLHRQRVKRIFQRALKVYLKRQDITLIAKKPLSSEQKEETKLGDPST